MIKTTRQRQAHNGYKFGLRLPKTVPEALEIDRLEGHNLWRTAIEKEMANVQVAFDILDDGSPPPPRHKRIPLRMIFDIKMDFTRKARFVAGGH